LALWTSRTGDKRVLFPISGSTRQDVVFVKELIEAGNVVLTIGGDTGR
jgi:hypothetical protein